MITVAPEVSNSTSGFKIRPRKLNARANSVRNKKP